LSEEQTPQETNATLTRPPPQAQGVIEPPSEQNVSDYEKRGDVLPHSRLVRERQSTNQSSRPPLLNKKINKNRRQRDGRMTDSDYGTFVADCALKPMSATMAYLQASD
jgi:hypothetical protein